MGRAAGGSGDGAGQCRRMDRTVAVAGGSRTGTGRRATPTSHRRRPLLVCPSASSAGTPSGGSPSSTARPAPGNGWTPTRPSRVEDVPSTCGLIDVHVTPLSYDDVPFSRVYTEGRVDDAEMGIALPGRPLRRVCGSGVQVHDEAGSMLGIVVAPAGSALAAPDAARYPVKASRRPGCVPRHQTA